MEFGVFATGTVGPKPWDESEPRVLRADVKSGIVADECGFDTFLAQLLRGEGRAACEELRGPGSGGIAAGTGVDGLGELADDVAEVGSGAEGVVVHVRRLP